MERKTAGVAVRSSKLRAHSLRPLRVHFCLSFLGGDSFPPKSFPLKKKKLLSKLLAILPLLFNQPSPTPHPPPGPAQCGGLGVHLQLVFPSTAQQYQDLRTEREPSMLGCSHLRSFKLRLWKRPRKEGWRWGDEVFGGEIPPL